MCADKEDEQSLLWSCLTFVSCVMGNSLRVLVQPHWSCCIALWIQLGVGGAQMAVFMCFLCWLACCWVWCGLQRGEVKRTNTFLLKIPLWTQEFEQLLAISLRTHWPLTSPALCVSPLWIGSPSPKPLFTLCFLSKLFSVFSFFFPPLYSCLLLISLVLLSGATFQLLHQIFAHYSRPDF